MGAGNPLRRLRSFRPCRMGADGDRPVRRPDGRYDNVDFTKAIGFKLPKVKASYLRRDVLLFVRFIHLGTNARR